MEYKWETMGMIAKLIVVDGKEINLTLDMIKKLFIEIDNKFSTYKTDSEINKFNAGKLKADEHSELAFLLKECAKTKTETNGYFDCNYTGVCDPSGLVKGYAISEATKLLKSSGYRDYLIEISGDAQTNGLNMDGQPWQIGIENPFNREEIVKVVKLNGEGIATSGTSVHPNHIINPLTHTIANEIASISVISANIYDADRMATAAFAMGKKGIEFIQNLEGYAGYMITNDRQAIMTEGFKKYV